MGPLGFDLIWTVLTLFWMSACFSTMSHAGLVLVRLFIGRSKLKHFSSNPELVESKQINYIYGFTKSMFKLSRHSSNNCCLKYLFHADSRKVKSFNSSRDVKITWWLSRNRIIEGHVIIWEIKQFWLEIHLDYTVYLVQYQINCRKWIIFRIHHMYCYRVFNRKLMIMIKIVLYIK